MQARCLRNSLVDVLDSPYITVARGKGLSERAVLLRHRFRSALVAFVFAFVFALVFAFFLWIPVARVVRAEVSSLREREFVQAESLGASDRRIFFRDLLPNASGTMIIAATSLFAQVFLLEAMLDFLSLGVSSAIEPNDREPHRRRAARVSSVRRGLVDVASPAALLVLILVCILLGDGLSDALKTAAAALAGLAGAAVSASVENPVHRPAQECRSSRAGE
jgi:ABC-type dipeptide/oligopeptide/nickel transport system permease subunit